MKIKAVIEKAEDGRFSIFTDNKIGANRPGGFGDTVEEAKEDFLESVEESCKDAVSDGFSVSLPVRIEYHYDLPSFFNHFDYLNVSRFARFAGINESQMRLYKTGRAYPCEKTTQKILHATLAIAGELSQVHL